VIKLEITNNSIKLSSFYTKTSLSDSFNDINKNTEMHSLKDSIS